MYDVAGMKTFRNIYHVDLITHREKYTFNQLEQLGNENDMFKRKIKTARKIICQNS